ncbi:MAG: lycopene beta-cyclase CrtY [Gemmatimonadota bacterium]|nr:MAG: lycopene beta-cyclase CrtY [Gemmatimonadota bacterium]
MDADLALVGGGLANSLIAYHLVQTRADIDLLLLERDGHLGGEHTWSFNSPDLTPRQHDWINPLVQYRWPGYEVRFPEFTRWIEGGYQTITSTRLHDVVARSLGDRILFNSNVTSIDAGGIGLSDGRRVRAKAIVDGRGPSNSSQLVIRYQKFVGQVLRLEEPHGLRGPILMDATVEQLDGYRFVYVLPFEDDLALVEDTRYSDVPGIERDRYVAAIEDYVGTRGWKIKRVEYEEQGVLPVALSGDIGQFWEDGISGVARSGLRAALFHPTTGYSLPNAVRLAERIGRLLPLSASELYDLTRLESVTHWNETGFFRMLNRMLFLAGEPAQRFRVFQRFYRLPAPLIERFYAGRLKNLDRFRLLVGRPPVPVGRAAAAVMATGRREAVPGYTKGREDD